MAARGYYQNIAPLGGPPPTPSGAGDQPPESPLAPARKKKEQVGKACVECRRRKSKCSGLQPCTRCMTYGKECVFEEGQKEALQRMSDELDDNRAKLESFFTIIRDSEPGTLLMFQGIAQQCPSADAFLKRIKDAGDRAERDAPYLAQQPLDLPDGEVGFDDATQINEGISYLGSHHHLQGESSEQQHPSPSMYGQVYRRGSDTTGYGHPSQYGYPPHP